MTLFFLSFLDAFSENRKEFPLRTAGTQRALRKTRRGCSRPTVTAGVGSRRLALAVASQSLADVRAIARAKPKAARFAGGKPDGWGDGVKIEN